MIENDIFIANLLNIIELFAYLYCLAIFFGKKFKFSIHAVVLILLTLLLLTGVNNYGTPVYLRSLVYVGMFLYGLLYYRKSIKVTLVNCILSAILVMALQLLLYLPIVVLVSLNTESAGLVQVLIGCGSLLFIMLLNKYLPLIRLSEILLKRNKLLVCVFIFIILIFGIKLYQVGQARGMVGENFFQIMYFLAFTAFLIYEWQKSKSDAEKQKLQLEMNKLYYGAYDQLLMLVRERQHDMKNHISAIMSMIYTTKDYETLASKQKEYCDYVLEQNEQTKLLLSAENPLIVGFVYSKQVEVEAKEIEMEQHIKISSKELFLPEYELVDMIGILVDNALEALADLPVSERKIYLALTEDEEGITLTVANVSKHYDEDMTVHFFEFGYSSKGKDRGIGLTKLKRIVDKWNGTITVSNELHSGINYLSFEIMIPKKLVSKSKIKNK